MNGHHNAQAFASVTLTEETRFRIAQKYGRAETVEIHSAGVTLYASGAANYTGSGFVVNRDGQTGAAKRTRIGLSASEVPGEVRRVLAEHLEAAALDLYNATSYLEGVAAR